MKGWDLDILLFLIPLSFFFAGSGLMAFIWATKSGQFADMKTPAERLVFEDFQDSSREQSI
jgi:cbb3-type cytochrome oxidase maturation protein